MRDLYEDNYVLIRMNSSHEVFVQYKTVPDAEIRVGDDANGITVTAAQGTLTPWSVNGLPAFRVRERNSVG